MMIAVQDMKATSCRNCQRYALLAPTEDRRVFVMIEIDADGFSPVVPLQVHACGESDRRAL